jgi:hypothetical protein
MKAILAATALAFAACPSTWPADADARTPVVAELFTSEGCSSCPPADSFLRKLDHVQPVPNARIIVLSEHVDYWNSSGWRDPFSSSQFTRRQENYAERLGSEVFTPQLVIDGREQFVGADARSIQAAIERAAARPKLAFQIRNAKRDGSNVAVQISLPGFTEPQGEVWLAIADDIDESNVTRGENSGRTLSHVGVVRRLEKVADIRKRQALETTLRVPFDPAWKTHGKRVVAFLESNHAIIAADSASLQN